MLFLTPGFDVWGASVSMGDGVTRMEISWVICNMHAYEKSFLKSWALWWFHAKNSRQFWIYLFIEVNLATKTIRSHFVSPQSCSRSKIFIHEYCWVLFCDWKNAPRNDKYEVLEPEIANLFVHLYQYWLPYKTWVIYHPPINYWTHILCHYNYHCLPHIHFISDWYAR